MPGWQSEPENFRRGCKNGAEQRQSEEVDRGGSKHQPLAGDFWLERKGEGSRDRRVSGGKANKCAFPWQPVEGKRSPQEGKAAKQRPALFQVPDSCLGKMEERTDKMYFMVSQ